MTSPMALASPVIHGTSPLKNPVPSSSSSDFLRAVKLQLCPFRPPSSPFSQNRSVLVSRSQIASVNGLEFVLHDALSSSGIDTIYAREARTGFFSQIEKLSSSDRETSISSNVGVDLGGIAIYIAAEDDSLVSHSSVPLPVDAFLERLDGLSMQFYTNYSSSFRSPPDNLLQCIEKYLYVDKAFRRSNARSPIEQRGLYLPSVLTHRSGSATMLSLIYSEILKMLRLWGFLDFDAEISSPRDSHSLPKGYQRQKTAESENLHALTIQSLLVEILTALKNAFWPFQLENTQSLFLRAAYAANCFDGSNNIEESAFRQASAKAARHRLERGVWTSVRFGDMRRALSACERLILLETDVKELRDYGVLLYHCGFYKESLQFLRYYQDAEKQSSSSFDDMEEDAVEKLLIRLNLLLMEEEGWSRRPSYFKKFLSNIAEPW